MKYKYIGTEDLVGATVVSVDSTEMQLEKDGRSLLLTLEEEPYWNSMNDCQCGGGYGPSYFRAQETI